jgi:hypothetical protein
MNRPDFKTHHINIIPGRIWLYAQLDGVYGGFRHSFIPWISADEYLRKTLVLPAGPIVLVIASNTFGMTSDELRKEEADGGWCCTRWINVHLRWRRYYAAHGSLTRNMRKARR